MLKQSSPKRNQASISSSNINLPNPKGHRNVEARNSRDRSEHQFNENCTNVGHGLNHCNDHHLHLDINQNHHRELKNSSNLLSSRPKVNAKQSMSSKNTTSRQNHCIKTVTGNIVTVSLAECGIDPKKLSISSNIAKTSMAIAQRNDVVSKEGYDCVLSDFNSNIRKYPHTINYLLSKIGEKYYSKHMNNKVSSGKDFLFSSLSVIQPISKGGLSVRVYPCFHEGVMKKQFLRKSYSVQLVIPEYIGLMISDESLKSGILVDDGTGNTTIHCAHLSMHIKNREYQMFTKSPSSKGQVSLCDCHFATEDVRNNVIPLQALFYHKNPYNYIV